ncbi:MAG: serine hydrolase domain-containing protein [Actinomycetota bacterium]
MSHRSIRPSRLRLALATCTVTVIGLTLLPAGASAAPKDPTAALEQSIDALVHDFVDQTNLPGITVAVTRKGRLLLTKGYGHKLVDGATKIPMTASMRSRIGSVSKAIATGPAAYQLLLANGIDPQTTTLYGPGGLFEGDFDSDIAAGIANFAPESADWEQWYSQITIQHLFDHRAGLNGGGDISGAAQMFGVAEQDVTYAMAHSHFLQNRALLFEPGTNSKYSNHGMGLFTLIIERLSGKSYYNYVRDDYLAPMGMQNRIRPEYANPDSCDAYNHTYGQGDTSSLSTSALPAPEPLPFEQYGLGLAAGGFRSSAQDLTWAMRWLTDNYSWDEIDRMGWFKSSKGKLGHSGSIGGGKAYVAMFPKGYESNSGLNLSEVSVAVATNIRVKHGSVSSLASQIALQVPQSHVPHNVDLWREATQSCARPERIGSFSSRG